MAFAGVELGGTKCVAILADGPQSVIAQQAIPTTTPDETLGAIEAILIEWKAAYPIEALGIASFGPVRLDPAAADYGHILATTKPGWPNSSVAPRLEQALGIPTALDTDVNGAALAEINWGSGRGLRDFAYVTVGTGVGVGLIVNGAPTRGFAHCELGHIRVARLAGDDWSGSCPYHQGCVEGLASGSALAARYGDRISTLAPDDPAWNSVAWSLAQLCHAIVCAAAPQRIAIGGGVLSRQPHLMPTIGSMLGYSLNGYMPLPDIDDFIRGPELGDQAGPLGAIAVAMTATPRPR